MNAFFRAASSGPLSGIIEVSDKDRITSQDILGREVSAVIQGPATFVSEDGRKLTIFAWYDNEFGYANRIVDLTALIQSTDTRTSESVVLRDMPAPVKAVFEQKFGGKLVRDGDATASSSPVGGIDLDAEYLNLKVERDGNGIPLPLPFQPVETIHVNGLVPVIINIMPVNMPLIFGAVNENKNKPLADTDSGKPLDSARNKYFEGMNEEEALIKT